MQTLAEYRDEREMVYMEAGATPEEAVQWAAEDTAELAREEAEERE